jgi:hypothetical protein
VPPQQSTTSTVTMTTNQVRLSFFIDRAGGTAG